MARSIFETKYNEIIKAIVVSVCKFDLKNDLNHLQITKKKQITSKITKH